MRTKSLNILHVFILALRCLTLDADSENPDCGVQIKVRRNTVFKAFPGEDLRTNCTVASCNKKPPTVTWFKFETTDVPVPVNVSSGSHIREEWDPLNDYEGISFLHFQKILRNDSGEYQCRSEDSVSHNINVSVYSEVELTTVACNTSEPESGEIQDNFWPFVYRVVGIMVFVMIVLILCVATRFGCKEQSSETPDPSGQPFHDASPPAQIYDNDQ
ncbi:B- and T-lymphocyte attenuator-like [Centropristis striata]|uniref:B- and T-lymphocyte attenuator-like n=1 Tax=Centropristis striata TaxID=184440 RepID=UPI0027E15F5C|nr:B- and T-lymphocyte attenuator-like [Centropristis striata]